MPHAGYHVRGTHGISPTSGLVFLPPLKLRCYADSVGTTEGLCHSCSKWIQCVARSLPVPCSLTAYAPSPFQDLHGEA